MSNGIKKINLDFASRGFIKSIPTEYRGVTFRSKQEARFASWCDSHKQQWVYEPDGLTDGSARYLPDFYLPQSKLIVEIKPYFFLKEAGKMEFLLKSSQFDEFALAVVAMEQSFRLLMFSEVFCGNDYDSERGWIDYVFSTGFCKKCGALHFYGDGYWACPGCGHYAGDETHDRSLGSFDLCVAA